jgi:hypothetical protein
MRGFTLVPVVLAMSIVAVVAFLLNRDNGLNARMITQQADLERARYAAQAGLQAANFALQAAGCSRTAAASVSNPNFGGASYSAYSDTATGSPTTLLATGTYKDASVTLTRAGVHVYQPRTTRVIQPDGSAGQDVFVDSTLERNFGRDTRLRLQSGRYAPLVKIALSDLPAGTRVVPWYDSANAKLQPGAVLSLYQYDIASSGTGTLVLHAHPVNRSWLAGTRTGGGTPDGATWLTYDGNSANTWSAPGAGYGPTALATTPYTGAIGWVDWDLTNAVAAWMDGVHANHGVWIVPGGGTIGNTAYVSSNDNSNAAWRPKLTLSVQEPCGAQHNANIPLGADAYLISGADQTRNFGGALVMEVNQGSPERRIVLRFDVSSIPPGSVVKSANLRLYCRTITSPTNLAKTLRAYYVMEAWTEGTLSGTGTANGATWTTRNGTNNWSASGGYAYWSSVLGTAREEASGALPLPGAFRQGWVAFDLTAMTQYWVDNLYANYGLLLRSESSSDILQFDSRESVSGTAPQLVVVYQ